MPNYNQNSNQNLIFPEDTPTIISEILKKYELDEVSEKVLEKLEKEEKTNGEIVTDLIEKVAKEKISFKKLVYSLKIELNISQKKAEELAKDLRKNILLLVEKSAEVPPSLVKKESPEEKPPTPKDVYREPIE